MATSGSTSYTDTEQELIDDAFYASNIYGAEESISSADYEYARRLLNRMLKQWQAKDLHLWLKETATIFLQKGQNIYELYSSGDNATLSYEETTLSTDYATGADTFVFNTAISYIVGDIVGIELDDGSLYWSTVKTSISTTSFEINGTIPSDASSGKRVYTYRTRLDEPFNVYSAVREDKSEIDTVMPYISYEEYFQLPNKTSSSTPVSYNYDRQLGKAVIRIWPTPQDVEYLMKITMSRKIEDFITNSNTPDLPQEWYDAIFLKLAVRLCHAFGRTGTQRYQDLRLEAEEAFNTVSLFDSEQGSIYFQVDNSG